MKRGELLSALEAEAGVRYDDTRLARRAGPARRRLAWMLAVGAAALAVEAVVGPRGWLAGAAALAVLAWGARAGRLAAVIGATLAALLFACLPVWFLATQDAGVPATLTLALSIVYGVAMLPDLVLLLRDAELQHAFGLWARRDER